MADRNEIHQDVLDVLDEVKEWTLAPARWESISGLLEAISSAVEADDLQTLRLAAGQLELMGPVRVIRIGAATPAPAPPRVRERLNHLVRRLSGGTPADGTHPSPETGPSDGSLGTEGTR